MYLTKEADEIKLKMERKKIATSEQMEEVWAWSDKIDKGVEGVDAEINQTPRKVFGESQAKIANGQKRKRGSNNREGERAAPRV